MVKKDSKKSSKLLWIFIVIVILVIILGSGFLFKLKGIDVSNEPGEYDTFTQCLVDSGVKMYGSITCSVCSRQKKLFGNSFRLINEIECNPHEKYSQAEKCLEVGIDQTPTWILEENGAEIDRLVGYQPLEKLAEFSGCTLGVS